MRLSVFNLFFFFLMAKIIRAHCKNSNSAEKCILQMTESPWSSCPRDDPCELSLQLDIFQGRFRWCCLRFSLDNRPQTPFSVRTRTSLVIAAWSSVACACRVCLTSFQISATANPAAVNGLCPHHFVSSFWEAFLEDKCLEVE